jgi:hypothetical protein
VTGDPNGDGITSTDRVPGTRRNEFSTPPIYQVDMRVGRIIRFGERYRLSLFAEGFNIFNRSNVQNVFRNLYGFSNATTGQIHCRFACRRQQPISARRAVLFPARLRSLSIQATTASSNSAFASIFKSNNFHNKKAGRFIPPRFLFSQFSS